jgi:MFS family permease
MTAMFTLVTIYIVAFTGFAGFSWLSVVTPYYFSSLGIGVSDIGLMIGVYAYVNAAGMFPCSILSERWGRRKFLIMGLVLATIAPLLYPFAKDIWLLYAIIILHGLGSTMFVPTALALVTELSEPAEFGKSIGWYSASAQLGLMAGPMAGGFILQQFGFVAAYTSCGFMALLALILVIIRMRHIPVKIQDLSVQPGRSWGWLSNRGIVISLLALIMIAAGASSINTFIPLYVRGYGINEAVAGLIITACYASSAALRIPAGTLSDRFGNAPLVLVGTALSGAAIALVALFTEAYQIALAALLFGIGIGFAMPSALAWLARISPQASRGMAMGIGSASYQVGLAVGATTLGAVVQNSGYPFMYFSLAAAIGLSALIMIVFMKAGHPSEN